MKFEFFKNPTEKHKIAPKEEYISKIGRTPIRASIVDSKDTDPETLKTIGEIKESAQFVDFDGSEKYFTKNKIRNAGLGTYMISESNDRNKYSEGYFNCTGLVVVGEDLESGKQISFMSHQNPSNFLHRSKEKFIQDMVDAFNELKEKVKEKSIDVVIFAGQKNSSRDYESSVQLLGELFKKEFNLEPTVMTGPNSVSFSSTEVYFDTQNRRLFIIRPLQKNKLNESYTPTELEQKRKDW